MLGIRRQFLLESAERLEVLGQALKRQCRWRFDPDGPQDAYQATCRRHSGTAARGAPPPDALSVARLRAAKAELPARSAELQIALARKVADTL
ncbi:hypothetical protein H8F24_17355 [Synechococcus sp. CBW1002]|uniref:hypothetical protein n=1 Tax=Synechococcus sp. CBW1002 TaxID=1353134 RepID=UPI0018CF04D9|nr:hypothetical protein [Synechococcus sp. CBW1002]QPN59697.1 hypothetical protein H8F24_17355 [Synechococcus sp. CBW1002]